MKISKRVLIGIGVFILIILQIGLFLPHEFRYERVVWIDADPDDVFPYINNLKNWDKWTVWNKENDPSIQTSYPGPEEGEGAVRNWTSKKNGEGSIEIILSIEDRLITYDKIVQKEGFKTNGKIELIESDGGTSVIWVEEGDFGYNIAGRYLGLIMDSFEGRKLYKSLLNLKEIIENE